MTDCIPYDGHINASGYGVIRTTARSIRAHIAAWEAVNGPVPDGLVLDHTCHTNDRSCPGGPACMHRRCVNPDHLEPVTQIENVMRGMSPPARNARKTHCARGHEFTPENTGTQATGRYCRTCRRATNAVLVGIATDALAAGLVDPPHGTASTYTNYGCRCVECCAAKSAAYADWKRRRAAASEPEGKAS